MVSVIQTEPGRIVGVERGGVRYTDRTCGNSGGKRGVVSVIQTEPAGIGE